MKADTKIVVYGVAESGTGLDIHYRKTERLNAAIDDLLEFIEHNTPICSSSLQALEFVCAVAQARGQSIGMSVEAQ